MKASDIIEIMNNWALPSLIDDWDNTGFQIGSPEKEIHKILIALDLDIDILNKAIAGKYDMIITHHPLIFKPLQRIVSDNYQGNLIMEIIKNDIVVYNAHSNLDLAPGGVNHELAEVLGLKNTKPLSKVDIVDNKIGYGRIGDVEEIALIDYLPKIKTGLKIDKVIVHGDTNKTISKVAVCGGSGASFIKDAYKNNADIYITGDIKYHDGQLAHELGLTIVDAGHFDTEKIILPVIKEYLDSSLDKKVEIDIVMESSIPQDIY